MMETNTLTKELDEYLRELKSGNVLWQGERSLEEAAEHWGILQMDDDIFFKLLEERLLIWRHDWTCVADYDGIYLLWFELDVCCFARRLTPEQLAKFCHLAGLPPPERGEFR